MAIRKITCPSCGKTLECGEFRLDKAVICTDCKSLIPLRKNLKTKIFVCACIGIIVTALVIIHDITAVHPYWPDRRPIGMLFLASSFHSSATNPRGWFNGDNLDFIGSNGFERFRKALFDYADRSIVILKQEKAQGMIIWDLEGEQFPHKITFIGDPRTLDRLAPEMNPVADEFFKKFRDAGLRVGLTIRPQQLIFRKDGQPQQVPVLDIKRILLEKIDYARARWGVTLFYLDSNDGLWRPDELFQLRSLAEERPDILLIPEHHYSLYRAFSAPYVALHSGASPATSALEQKLFPNSFQVLNLADATNSPITIALAQRQGDILLFRAWFSNPDCQLLDQIENEK